MSPVTRRDFLRHSGVAVGSLVLGCSTTHSRQWPNQTDHPDAEAFDAWLAITPSGEILVQAFKVEMGQGTYTAFATLVGEELRTSPQSITLLSAPVGAAFGAPMQGTGGSTSLKEIWQPMRESAARAREMLIATAAGRWAVEPASLTIDEGAVVQPASGARLSFGELAEEASQRNPPRDVTLTAPSEWRYIGTSAPRVDAKPKSTGEARYGMDVQLPGMLTAVVVHCPHPRGTLQAFDDKAAREQEGVVDVFPLGEGVAVVATSYWRARTAARQLEVTWDPGPSRGVDSAAIQAGFARALDEADLHSARDDGDAASTLASAPSVLEAEYSLPYLAHATMEPMNCTVAPRKDGCDVYLGTQAPGIAQDAVAHELGLPRDQVIVHNQLLGGGFGRRFFSDMASEAAQIARQVNAPVKLVWSREDDTARDFYRPASLHRLRASLDSSQAPDAWEHKLVAPSLFPYMGDLGGAIAPQWMRGFTQPLIASLTARVPGWFGPILGIEGANDVPYAIPNVSVSATAWDPGIPVGIWRSVGHSHNGFVVESFVDELANAAGEDPAAYRSRLLRDHPRHLAVLEQLVAVGRWGNPAEGTAQGIAIHESFGTVVGQIAEVSTEGGTIHVHRVACVVDCGLVINPDIVVSQMESSVHFGLTAALYGEIHFKDGAAVESNFHDHPMLRLAEAPEVIVEIVPSSDPPSGVGEPGTPPIAPAVANAVYAATGTRLRSLPLRLS